MKWLIILILLFTLKSESKAEIYRWIDENGKIHISDENDNVPSNANKNLEEIKRPQQPKPTRATFRYFEERIYRTPQPVQQIKQRQEQPETPTKKVKTKIEQKTIEIPSTVAEIKPPELTQEAKLPEYYNLKIVIPSIVAFVILSLTPIRNLLLWLTGLASMGFIAQSIIGTIPLPLKIHLIAVSIIISFLEIRSLYKFYTTEEP